MLIKRRCGTTESRRARLMLVGRVLRRRRWDGRALRMMVAFRYLELSFPMSLCNVGEHGRFLNVKLSGGDIVESGLHTRDSRTRRIELHHFLHATLHLYQRMSCYDSVLQLQGSKAPHSHQPLIVLLTHSLTRPSPSTPQLFTSHENRCVFGDIVVVVCLVFVLIALFLHHDWLKQSRAEQRRNGGVV